MHVGSGTVGGYICTDHSEKAGLPANAVKNTYVQLHNWLAELRAEVAVSANNVAKGRGKNWKGGQTSCTTSAYDHKGCYS